jgi:hypothetical protein
MRGMKGNGPISALVLIMALTLACGPEPQGGPGSGGEAGYGRMYDPKTVETVSGEVLSVAKNTDRGQDSGVSLTLRTAQETILVYLGPDWFLARQDLALAPRDRVEITGSQCTVNGKPALIAGQVKKGDKTLKLRDPAGIPAWAGAGDHSRLVIGKWLLQEMVETSEFKHPNETAEKKWGNLEIFSTNTLEFYSSDTRGKWNLLNDGRIKVISDYWGTFFLSTEGDKLIMTFPDDQIKYIYKKVN